jgi:hypothetical protein
LPNGLSFNTATGAITGTPSAASAATNYTITAYNLSGTSTTTLSITIQAAAGQGQSLNQNYVMTNGLRVAGIVNDSTLSAAVNNSTKVQTSIQYTDGLDRPVQTVQQQASIWYRRRPMTSMAGK